MSNNYASEQEAAKWIQMAQSRIAIEQVVSKQNSRACIPAPAVEGSAHILEWSQMEQVKTFTELTPDLILDAVEEATGRPFTPLAHSHPSYINRVYELQAADGERLIAKFYRPGRWSAAALREEHRFVLDCEAEDIPVIAPLPLENGDTLGDADGYAFALYPKRWGRVLEVTDEESWIRLGRVMARIHLAGQQQDAEHRVTIHPAHSTTHDVNVLLEGDLIDPMCHREFEAIARDTLDLITPLFDDCDLIRIHGDAHAANILDRPDEGIMVIDFDDMAMGPPVHDLWMLLPGNKSEARYELDLILEGYEQMREFQSWTLRLVEPLRMMRMLYFLAWAAMQSDDPGFRHNFPDWGTHNFWQREIGNLRIQLQNIRDELEGHRSWQ